MDSASDSTDSNILSEEELEKLLADISTILDDLEKVNASEIEK
jgi:hypothetical protein